MLLATRVGHALGLAVGTVLTCSPRDSSWPDLQAAHALRYDCLSVIAGGRQKACIYCMPRPISGGLLQQVVAKTLDYAGMTLDMVFPGAGIAARGVGSIAKAISEVGPCSDYRPHP